MSPTHGATRARRPPGASASSPRATRARALATTELAARARWLALPSDASREEWFDALREAIREGYLAEPADPYRQSGRSSGAARWEATRRCVADAIERGGDVMDIGCANGLLLESVASWCGERGLRLVPHGIDLVSELVALARERHPMHAENFEVANVLDWRPRRRYDVVRVSIEFVRPPDRRQMLRHVHDDALARGGRLIACHYASRDEPLADVAALLREAGIAVGGIGGADGVALAYGDRPLSAEGPASPSPA